MSCNDLQSETLRVLCRKVMRRDVAEALVRIYGIDPVDARRHVAIREICSQPFACFSAATPAVSLLTPDN
jgi:hypothetical protein